jgi:hypothetical protein
MCIPLFGGVGGEPEQRLLDGLGLQAMKSIAFLAGNHDELDTGRNSRGA